MKLLMFLLIAVIFSLSNLAGISPSRPNFHKRQLLDTLMNSELFNVNQHGAKGDAKTDDSKAFLAAWQAACNCSSPSIVYVPSGKFLLNPVSFQGPCMNDNITMQVIGELIASADKSLWNGEDSNYWLQFKDVNRLTVEGGGSLDGQGASWWETCTEDTDSACQDGPTSLRFTGTSDTILRDITSINSKQFHIDFDSCNNVEVHGLTIQAPADSPNTDGIHIQQSSNVNIRDIFVGTGDDCISIGSGSSNISIELVTCGPGHGISVGSLGKDQGEAGVRNVTVDGVSFSDTQNGVRIKTWEGGRGSATDLTFQNVKMDNVQNPILIDQYYCPHSNDCFHGQASGVKISGVLYKNISGTSATKVAMAFQCSQSVPCEGIKVQDVQLKYNNNGKDIDAQSSCKNAEGSAIGLVNPPSCL
eukprot:Gb_33196 [translate_table: standard]